MKPILFFYALLFSTVYFAQNNPVTADKLNGFVQNKGQVLNQNSQTNSSVRYFHSNEKWMNCQLRETGFSYDLIQKEHSTHKKMRINRIDFNFLGASHEIELEAALPFVSSTKQRYMNYNNRLEIEEHFEEIRYKNVYPHIDVVFKLDQKSNQIKYDFVLKPGSTISDIKLEVKGIDSSYLSSSNELLLFAGNVSIKEWIPSSFILETGKEVAITYVLSKSKNNDLIVQFETKEKIPHDQTLIIDPLPELSWSTYFGGLNETYANSVITNVDNYVYVCGKTNSLEQIATEGAYQIELTDSLMDAYMLKMDRNGEILWSTYLGGTLLDEAVKIFADSSYVYVVGNTSSPDIYHIDTTLASDFKGQQDGFLAKLTAGGELLWFTYLGGDSLDNASDLAVDNNGFIYVVGSTLSDSLNFITENSFQPTKRGDVESYLVKFTPDGTLQWGTFFGGELADSLLTVCTTDTSVFIGGFTRSLDSIVSPLAFQDSLRGLKDGFIAKFNHDGTFAWSTYFGGFEDDEISSMIAFNEHVYFAGNTKSTEGIAIGVTILQQAKHDETDGFLGRISHTGAVLWATYFGGEGTDIVTDLAVELDSNVFLSGYTNSDSLYTTNFSYQQFLAGGTDGYVAKFKPNGVLAWSTFYGGSENDTLKGIDVYGNTAIYAVGYTNSDSIPVGLAYPFLKDSLSGTVDAFFIKLLQDKSTPPGGGQCGGGGTANIFCPGEVLTLSVLGGETGPDAAWVWYANNCGELGEFIGTGEVIQVIATESMEFYVRAESTTNATACAIIPVQVYPQSGLSLLSSTSVCEGESYTFSANQQISYEWTGPNEFYSNEASPVINSSDSSHSGTYALLVESQYGCPDTLLFDLVVAPYPTFTSVLNDVTCYGGTNGSLSIELLDTLSASFIWLETGDTLSFVDSLIAGEYHVSITNEFNCQVVDTFVVNQPATAFVESIIHPVICSSNQGSISLTVDGLNPTTDVFWPEFGVFGLQLNELDSGSYLVNLIVDEFCTEHYVFDVPYEDPLISSIGEVGNETCHGLNDGFVNVLITGATLPYTLSLDTIAVTSSSITNLTPGNYTAQILDSKGCLDSLEFTILPAFKIEFQHDTLPPDCGKENGQIALQATNYEGVNTVLWNTGNTSSTLVNLMAGLYWFTYTDSTGCAFSDTITLNAYNNLQIDLNTSSSIIYGNDSSFVSVLSPNNPTTYSFNWLPNDFISCNTCPSTYLYPPTSTMYEVTVTHESGCFGQTSVYIEQYDGCIELFVPTIFSPNGDGLNDNWCIIGSCILNLELVVYDEWGEVIFHSTEQEVCWDGRFKGSLVSPDSYNYLLKVTNQNGNFSQVGGNIIVNR